MASFGRSSLPFARPLNPLQRCKILLLRPTPQAQAAPGPDQWLLMGVQACRLPGLKPLKPLQRFNLSALQNPLATPNPAGTSYPTATSMASYGRSSLPFARP